MNILLDLIDEGIKEIRIGWMLVMVQEDEEGINNVSGRFSSFILFLIRFFKSGLSKFKRNRIVDSLFSPLYTCQTFPKTKQIVSTLQLCSIDGSCPIYQPSWSYKDKKKGDPLGRKSCQYFLLAMPVSRFDRSSQIIARLELPCWIILVAETITICIIYSC